MRSRWLVLVASALILALAVSATGCGTQKKTRDYLVVYKTEPAFIDPYNSQESQGIQVTYDVFDSLVDFDPLTSAIKPLAAESWEPNADFTVWTFKLRKGTKFHNGREVKAEDFIYAWNRIVNPADKTVPAPSDISYHLAPVKGFDECQAATGTPIPLAGLRAVDDYTLEVTLSYGFPDFEYVVGHPALAPVPKEVVEKGVTYTDASGKEATATFQDMPIGNGAFKMLEPWKHNQYIKVGRVDDYWGDKAKLSGVTYKLFKDEQAAFLEFKAGKVDFTESIPTGQIKPTAAEYGESPDGYTVQPGKGVLLGAESSIYYYNANNAKKYLDDPRVRAAMSLAINRQNICDTIYEGTRKPATGFVPPGVIGYIPDQGQYCKYDPEQAKKLLADAGYAGGKGLPTFSLSYNTGSGHEDIAQAVQANLKDIGIQVKLEGMEWAQFVDFRQEGKHELARDGWISDYPIMDNMLYPLFLSSNAGKDNTSFYKNPKYDELVLAARKTRDINARVKSYQQAEKVMLDDAACIPITFYAHRAVGQKYVKDLIYSPLGLIPCERVSFSEAPAE